MDAHKVIIDGKGYTIIETAKKLGLHKATVGKWIRENELERFKKYLGFIPEIIPPYSGRGRYQEKRTAGPRKYIVYKVSDLDYKYGVDIAIGDTEEKAKANFMKSRKKSPLKFEILKVFDDRKTAIEYENKIRVAETNNFNKDLKTFGRHYKPWHVRG